MTDRTTVAHRPDATGLAYLVGSLLLAQLVLRPARPVYVQASLERMNGAATTEEIHAAVQKLRRRGWLIVATERRPGYRMIGMKTQLRTWSRRPVPQMRLLGR